MTEKERYGKSHSSHERITVNVLEGLSEDSKTASTQASSSSKSIDLRLLDAKRDYERLKNDAKQGRQ
jgi:hypothetical protein